MNSPVRGIAVEPHNLKSLNEKQLEDKHSATDGIFPSGREEERAIDDRRIYK